MFAFQQDEISEDTSCIDLNEHEKMETKVSMPRLYNFVYINRDSFLWKLLCFPLGMTESACRYSIDSPVKIPKWYVIFQCTCQYSWIAVHYPLPG